MLARGNNSISTNLSNSNLAQVADVIGLRDVIVPQPGQFGPLGKNTLADTLEAILGAVYEDSQDLNIVTQVMRTLGLA